MGFRFIVRDQEVDGSNPVVPTTPKILPSLSLRSLLPFDCCGVCGPLWTNSKPNRELIARKRPRAGTDSQNTEVWTNDDLEQAFGALATKPKLPFMAS